MKKLHSVSIDVTKRCTLKCKHCFNNSGICENEFQREELSETEILEITKDVLSLKPNSLCLCGGEPLLRKDIIYNIALYAYKNNLDTSINMVTNGELLSEAVADRLVQSHISNVQISLDGSTADSHDWLRNKKGSFEKAIQAIMNLDKARKKNGTHLEIAVAFCPNKKNYCEVEQLVELCHKLNVNSFRSQPLMLLGRAQENLKEYVLDKENYKILTKKIFNMQAMYASKGMIVEWGDPIDHLLIDTLENNSFFHITSNGFLLVTPYIPLSIGNLKDNSFVTYYNEVNIDEYWNHTLMKCFRSAMKSPTKMNLHKMVSMPDIGKGIVCVDALNDNYICQMDKLYKKYRQG